MPNFFPDFESNSAYLTASNHGPAYEILGAGDRIRAFDSLMEVVSDFHCETLSYAQRVEVVTLVLDHWEAGE